MRWSELVFLYITTITVPVAAKLCGLITMALLPCDTVGMTKPSRELDRAGRESNLRVATDTKISQPNLIWGLCVGGGLFLIVADDVVLPSQTF